jgi:integrase
MLAEGIEIDGVGPVWVIPAERMKAARQQRVPLSPAAQAVLVRARALAKRELIFPSPKMGGELADTAFTQLLR